MLGLGWLVKFMRFDGKPPDATLFLYQKRRKKTLFNFALNVNKINSIYFLEKNRLEQNQGILKIKLLLIESRPHLNRINN